MSNDLKGYLLNKIKSWLEQKKMIQDDIWRYSCFNKFDN
jgi:hypothetical protein